MKIGIVVDCEREGSDLLINEVKVIHGTKLIAVLTKPTELLGTLPSSYYLIDCDEEQDWELNLVYANYKKEETRSEPTVGQDTEGS